MQLILEVIKGAGDQLFVLLQVTVAMAFGAVIGFERELVDRPAGLRTHMLVTGAAALLVSLGEVLVRDFNVDPSQTRADPIRIIQAIVTGVSFLGAGTIIRADSGHVQGLTTAASLLFSTAIGIAVALNQFILAGGLTLLILLILHGLRHRLQGTDV